MQLHFNISKNIDFVFEHLTDMQKFVALHAAIYKMEPLGDHRYKVFETLKFAGIPFSFTYPATVEADPERKTVVMRAVVFRLTKIEMRFTLQAQDEHTTLIEEQIQFKTFLPGIKSVMRRVFKKQHEQLFKNMEAQSAEAL